MSGELGNIASAARFGINPTPLGAAGLGLGIASSMFGGKGGERITPKYQVNNGIYQYSNNQASGWKDVPSSWATDNPINPTLQVAHNLGLGGGSPIASNTITGMQQNPVSTNNYKLPNGGMINTATGQITLADPNRFNSENAGMTGNYIRGFQNFSKTNNGSFADQPTLNRLAQALQSAPSYVDPRTVIK